MNDTLGFSMEWNRLKTANECYQCKVTMAPSEFGRIEKQPKNYFQKRRP